MAIPRGNRWLVVSFIFATVLLGTALLAQAITKVTEVQPTSGKPNDTVTVTGANLGKASVSAVFLSDDKNDYKATIMEQSDGKIVAKIPQLKSGDYNISVQTGNQIIIEPVRFKVEE